MQFLSPKESGQWKILLDTIIRERKKPDEGFEFINLIHHARRCGFCFAAGVGLAESGHQEEAFSWLTAGAAFECIENTMCGYIKSYMTRNGGLVTSSQPFGDPTAYLPFTEVSPIKAGKEVFISEMIRSLPDFNREVRLLDIGCGDGSLTRHIIASLLRRGLVLGISDIDLVEPSAPMLSCAASDLSVLYPDMKINSHEVLIQEAFTHLSPETDIAIASLSCHHMPYQDKEILFRQIGEKIRHLLIFEIDANHDLPEKDSPELLVSIYQSYGRLITMLLSHPSPPGAGERCADYFLMAEVISLLTEERGVRRDYHMLKEQWNVLLGRSLGHDFTLKCDTTCYADPWIRLFFLHYGRE